MSVDEDSLLDTNVLVYALYPESEHYASSRRLLDLANDPESGLSVTSQIICERYSIITNPKRVSTPLRAEVAMTVIETLLALPGLPASSCTDSRCEACHGNAARSPSYWTGHFRYSACGDDARE